MSASPQMIFTSISQWRNAEISSLINRADPFITTLCAKAMNAQLPPEYRLDESTLETKEPKRVVTSNYDQWSQDPDQQDLIMQAWDYAKEYIVKLEEKFAEYVASGMTARQFG